jgi:transposase
VALRVAAEDRVRLVEERTAKLNELRATLKNFYPAFLDLFGELDSDITLEFLQQFPTQAQFQDLTPRRLEKWLRRHSYPLGEPRLAAMQAHLTAPVLSVADHLQQAKAPLIRYLATALRALNVEIAQRDAQLDQQFAALPEAAWIRSLPGVGDVLGPALLACLGRDPDRFASLTSARAFFGTAPVTKRSGKFRTVQFRHSCWKFARRTLQLFASASRLKCTWAQACYQRQRDAGRGHHAALRGLAHKWVKVLLAMRRTGAMYDPNWCTAAATGCQKS